MPELIIFAGTFLLQKYKQALAILGTKSMVMEALERAGGNPTVVEEWLAEERAYLENLSKEPLEETLEMEYFSLLVKLENSEYVFGPFFFFLVAHCTQKGTENCPGRLDSHNTCRLPTP